MTHSAGVVVFRQKNGQVEVLLGHMGAPWWAKKDAGAWTIPKGLIEENEDPLLAAKREFSEEFGVPLPDGVPSSNTTTKMSRHGR
jgi:predicted NUDIX family NTP pyrophosphohydrolase